MATYPLPIIHLGDAAPTDTSNYWQAGTVVLNGSPAAGAALGWICVTAGYPGTWKAIGVINKQGIATITAAAVLTIGSGLQLYNGAAGTCTLAAAASHAAGFEMTVKNIAAVNLTLATVAGATYEDAAAITLTQWQVVTLVGNGSTWYKKA